MSSIFLILGGGGQVATALLFTIIADVVPVAQRYVLYISMLDVVEFILSAMHSRLSKSCDSLYVTKNIIEAQCFFT
jgi:hypothetical protein